MDACHLSFKFPTELRHNSVEWSDCRRNRQERRQTCMLFLSRASARKQNGLEPQLVPYDHHTWRTDTILETDLVKAQEMSRIFCQTFSNAAVHFGDVQAECIARVDEHDLTILYERPS